VCAARLEKGKERGERERGERERREHNSGSVTEEILQRVVY
jgi:hypothetical protein